MREAARTLAGQGVTYGLQLAFVVVVARLLGPAGQGEFALLRTATYLVEPLLWLGLTSGMPYLVAKDSGRYHDPLLKAAAGYLVLAMLGIAIGVRVLSVHAPHNGILGGIMSHQTTFVWWLATLALLQLLQRTFVGQRRFMEYNTAYLLNAAIAFPVLAALGGAKGVSVSAAAQACIVANVIALAYALWAHRAHLDSAWRSTASLLPAVREAYAVGLKAYLSAVAFLILYRLDFFFVAHFLGTRALGVYTIAVVVVEAIQKVPDWLSLMLTPQVAGGRDAEGYLTRRYTAGAVGSVAVLGIAVAALSHWRPGLFGFVFGEGYDGAAVVLLMLLPRAVLHAVMVMHAAYLAGKGYPWHHPFAGMLGVLVLCLVDVFAIPRYELVGAVGGMTAAYAVATAVMAWGYGAQRRLAVAVTAG